MPALPLLLIIIFVTKIETSKKCENATWFGVFSHKRKLISRHHIHNIQHSLCNLNSFSNLFVLLLLLQYVNINTNTSFSSLSIIKKCFQLFPLFCVSMILFASFSWIECKIWCVYSANCGWHAQANNKYVKYDFIFSLENVACISMNHPFQFVKNSYFLLWQFCFTFLAFYFVGN